MELKAHFCGVIAPRSADIKHLACSTALQPVCASLRCAAHPGAGTGHVSTVRIQANRSENRHAAWLCYRT